MELWNPGVELMSREEMRALQLEKLKRQLVRVYQESPYYKSKFDQAKVDPAKLGSLDEIRRFPFFDKDEERASQEQSKEQFRHPLGTLTAIRSCQCEQQVLSIAREGQRP